MNENLGGKINTFRCVTQQEVLYDKIIRLEDISKTVVSIVTLFMPGDYIMDSLLLFFLILTANMRICHIVLKFTQDMESML
jgi:hypothetical protein